MTLSKPGHSRSKGNSASASIHEGTPEYQDGPEGYVEDASSWVSEDDQNKTSHYGYTTESSGVDRNTTPESSGVEMRNMPLPPGRFGSPFTYKPYQNKEDFFIGLLDKGTRDLFDQVVAEASTLRGHLSTEPSIMDNGDYPHLCYLKERGLPSNDTDISEESETNESKLEILTLRTNQDTWVLGDNMAIQADYDHKSNPGEIRYFIVNYACETLRVNDWQVERAVMAGPLPDFAVFQNAQCSYFWWRTAAALDYKPRFKRKCRFEYDDGESPRKALKNYDDGSYYTSAEFPGPYKPEPPPDPQVFLDSKNWLHEYRRRMEICEKRPFKSTSPTKVVHLPHQYLSGEMHSIDVILAIGAVWLGLMEAKIDFAYADSDLFSFARSMRMVGMHAVKGTNHFLMPLLFYEGSQALSPESEEDTAEPLEPVFSAFQRDEQQKHQENLATAEKAGKEGPGSKIRSPTSVEDQKIKNKSHEGGTGHFMLAIAEKVRTDPVSTVQGAQERRDLVRLRFMDSADGVVDRGLIRRVARNTVRHAGWLGDIWPRFDASEEDWADVLGSLENKSGEHTVLNAWAYMLDIPLATTRERGLGHSSYGEVRKMINLALRGQLDSLTIRAWMQHSKYAVDKPLSQLQKIQLQRSGVPDSLRNMQTVALNQDALSQIVKEMYTQEQAEKQTHTTKLGNVTVKPQGQRLKLNVLPSVTLPPSGQNSISTQDPASRQDPASASASSQDSTASSSSICISDDPPRSDHEYIKTWQDSLFQRLALINTKCNNTRRTTTSALKNATVIKRCWDLPDYDVVVAIATIWEGINRLGRPDFKFAYAGQDIFAALDGQVEEEKIGAVGGWSRFIMPMFFSRVDPRELENQLKRKETIDAVGHLLLCVAELVDVAEARERSMMTVQLEILDSRPGTVSEEEILRVAKRRIRDSRWLGKKGRQARVKYNLISRDVPRQVGTNTCGFYTILNAWAYMLSIPIHPGPFRRGRDETTLNDAIDNEFLSRGLQIINLALKGFMDSATIQAFFHVYGYSVEQRFGDPTRATAVVYAIGMNQDKLRRILRRRRMEEKTARARAEKKKFDDGDMTNLMQNYGMTEEEAWTALVMAKGHIDRAADCRFEWELWPQLPPAEDALSPQTPDLTRLFGQPWQAAGNALPSQAPDPR